MRWGVPIILALLPAALLLADGKGFSIRGGVDVATADQRAIIVFDGQRQTLVVETGLRGEGDEFAWVIPVPADPAVAPATRGVFTTLDRLTSPRLEGSSDPRFIIVLVLALTLSLAILGHYRAALYICLTVVLFMCVIGISLPAGRAGASASDNTGVRLHSRQTLGAYDVAVIGGDRGDVLLDWLHRESFHVPMGIDTVVDEYARRGWRFVVARMRAGAQARSQTLQPHPLAMTFSAAEPIYAMRLTGVGQREPITLDLFIFADGQAHVAGLDVWCAAVAERAPLDGHPRHLPARHHVAVRHPYLRSIVPSTTTVTRLRGQLTPSQMEQDLSLSLSPLRRTWRTVYTRRGGSNSGHDDRIGGSGMWHDHGIFRRTYWQTA